MNEQTKAPEGIISDFFDNIIQSFMKSQITSKNVNKCVLSLLENAEQLAANTENQIDDYVIDLVKRELEENWDTWYSYIATRLGLVAVPQSVDDLGDTEYTATGKQLPKDEVLTPETTTPELGIETILMVIELVLPYLIKWFTK